MPTYTFRFPAKLAGKPVSVFDFETDENATTGSLDGAAVFAASLPAGNYLATVRTGTTGYTVSPDGASTARAATLGEDGRLPQEQLPSYLQPDVQSATFARRNAEFRSLLASVPPQAQVDKVMASPPTVGALATATTLTGGIEWPSVDFSGGTINVSNSYYTYRAGGKIQVFGTAYPNYLYVNAKSITDPVNANNAPFCVDFYHDGTTLELMFKGTGSAIRVRVDGELIQEAPFTNTANGQTYFMPITFATRRLRKISVEGSVSLTWGGVNTAPTDTVFKGQLDGLRCIVIGDSFTDGTGATGVAANHWVRKFSESIGWPDTWASGLGGTGYVNPGTGGRVKFRDRVDADVIANAPDVVIVAGGINDYGHANAASIPTEADALFARIRSQLPDAMLVVLSPFWRGGPSTFAGNLLNTRDQIKAAAEAHDAIFLDVIEMPLEATPITSTVTAASTAAETTLRLGTVFPVRSVVEVGTGATKERRTVSAVAGAGPFLHTVKALTNAHAVGEPVTEVGPPLWSGTGKVGATTGDGNSDLYVSNDGTHPSQAGHDALGTTVARLLVAALSKNA